MRDYKFRGKTIASNEWVVGSLHVWESAKKQMIKTYIRCGNNNKDWLKVDPNTVGEYTGLKDNQGKEIYEGDILLSPYFEQDGRIAPCVVEWHDDGWDCTTNVYDDDCTLCTALSYGVEIAGNIHDNPDMKGGSK